jgi:hypothetical protein
MRRNAMEGERQEVTQAQEEERTIEWTGVEEVPEEERWAIACIQQMF